MASDNEEESAGKETDLGAALSGEEFRRMQQQLIDLRNLNYELMEKNKQLQNQTPKSNETFSFASKFMGRKSDKNSASDKCNEEINVLRSKLTVQEEEFRLQQSTLLAELNKVIAQNKLLEERLGEPQQIMDSEKVSRNEEALSVLEPLKTYNDLEKEIAWLKGVLAEKDSLLEDVELLNKDVLRAKDVESERANSAERKVALLEKQLEEKQRIYTELEETLKIKSEENGLLKSRLENLCVGKNVKFCDVASQYDFICGVDASTFCDQVAEEKVLVENQVSQTDSQFMIDYETLKKNADDMKAKYEKALQSGKKLELRIESLNLSNEDFLKEIESLKVQVTGMREEVLQRDAACVELQAELETFKKEKKEWQTKEEKYTEELRSMELRLKEKELNSTEELSALKDKFSELESQLEMECKQRKEQLKAKDEEMRVALKKQSSMVRELRHQVQQEKKRADQAEKQLEDALGPGRHYRVTGSPLVLSDHSRTDARNGAEGSSSACSWAFTFDGDESSCSASVLESDNVELISRLAQLQKKHSETIDRLNMVEEENTMLRKEVAEKSEVIAEWIRTRPCGDTSTSSSPSLRIRRMFDIVRIDDSAAGIRDMNRKLQRMLEETLSKNLTLQKNIQTLLESGKSNVTT